jgi:type I restriction enzyme S subunit
MSDDLPMGWASTALTEVIELHDSKRIPLNQQQRSLRQGIYPYYGANGQVDSIDDFLFDGEYILLAEDGGYFDDPSRNVAYEVSGRFWVNNHAHILSTRAIPKKFLTYALNNIDWMPYVGGSTRLKLTQEGMKRVLIPIPPLNEQRRIVDKLERIGDRHRTARNELSHIPKLIARYKQAVLADACSGKLTEEWREKNETVPSKIGSKNQNSTLNNWSLKKFNSVAEFKNGINFSKEQKGNKGIPTVDVLNMYSKGIYVDLEGLYKVDIDIKDDYILHYGDVLFVRSSVKKEGVGWASLFAKIDEIVTFCGFIIRARVDLSKVYPEFLTYFFRTDESRRILVDGSRQVTIANINQATLSEIELLLPPLEEQKEIVRRVEKMFEKIDRMEQEYQKAAKLCDRLEQATLAKAFRGELVPQGPYDEPASVLLEQVKREKEKGKKGK